MRQRREQDKTSFAARFHRDSGGQISFLTVFGAVIVVAMLSMVLNTGYQAASKVQLQNAVDAATLSAAGWYARGLNITSGLSVVQAQLMAAALLIDALASSADLAEPACKRLAPLYGKACVAGGGLLTAAACVCWAQLTFVCIPTLNIIGIPLSVLSQEFASHPSGIIWSIMRLLGKFNRGAHYFFNYGFLAMAGSAVAGQTAAPMNTTFIAFPGGWFNGEPQAFLPTKRAGNMSGLCKAAWDGSPGFQKLHDYPAGSGPLRLGFWRMNGVTAAIAGCALWPAIFDGFFFSGERGVCPGGGIEVWELDSSNQKLQVFGVVKAAYRTRVFSGRGLFRRPPEKMAWAEAEIYNGIAEESFSQDWRVRLRPVSLPWLHMQRLQGTIFAKVFNRLTGTSLGAFEVVNNH